MFGRDRRAALLKLLIFGIPGSAILSIVWILCSFSWEDSKLQQSNRIWPTAAKVTDHVMDGLSANSKYAGRFSLSIQVDGAIKLTVHTKDATIDQAAMKHEIEDLAHSSGLIQQGEQLLVSIQRDTAGAAP